MTPLLYIWMCLDFLLQPGKTFDDHLIYNSLPVYYFALL